MPNFATGQHTYMVVHEYDQKVFNTPSISQIAGACRNAIMPGKTRSTFIWTALYQMGANPIDTDRVWNLMQFFGGKAKDGKYHVATRWALEFGLGTPHKEVINSPEVQAVFCKWKDLKVATKQQETATTRDVAKTDLVPRMGLVHDGRGAGLHPRPAVDRPAHRQAAGQVRRAEAAISGLSAPSAAARALAAARFADRDLDG